MIFQLLLNLLWIFSINAEPLVQISHGTLNGTVEIARYGKTYSAFRGIPYAQPPIGNRRFKNPEPATAWWGIKQAKSFGNICPQNNNGAISGNDDCLFLNVYSPLLSFQNPLPRNKLLPVMVFIHGGSFLTGSSNIYGPGYLMEKDIILVTINYRLGILGFLTTGDAVASGNFGLKDQVEALRWIRKNIRSFGGDRDKVTIFGQSAGGVSVNLHSVSRASRGLFQKYIIQSGTIVGPGAYQKKQDFQNHVRDLAKLFNCPLDKSRKIINCLRNVNSDDLVKTSTTVQTIIKYGHFIWTPTVESNSAGAFLTEIPLNSVNNNRMKDLPFMSGTVTDEGLALTSGGYSNEVIYQMERSNIRTLVKSFSDYYKQDLDILFSKIDKFYFNSKFNTSSKIEFLNGMTKIFSDANYFYPQVRMLEKVTPKMRNSNYFYSFGYRGALSLTEVTGDKQNYGVNHADELLYLFSVTYGSYLTSNANFTQIDEKISKIMVDFWTSFATNGKPTSSELSNSNLWEQYSTNTTSHIQIGNIRKNTDPTVTMSNNYFTDRVNFWRENAPI